MSDRDIIRVSSVIPESIVDGPGIRTVIFTQGCPHRCEGCHNPQSHDFDGGCDFTVEELFESVRRNPMLTGVTFSGGEPFCQAAPLARLALAVKGIGLEVAVYTGYLLEDIISENDPERMELLRLADIVVDGRFVMAQRSLELKFRGSKNQRIINVSKSLEMKKPVLEASDRWT
jgi:anaerobic ribonucleoside-triphosphate reductase activating protein